MLVFCHLTNNLYLFMEFLEVTELLNSKDEGKMMSAIRGWGKQLPKMHEEIIIDSGFPKLVEAYDRPFLTESLDYLLERYKKADASGDDDTRSKLTNMFREIVKTTKLTSKQMCTVAFFPILSLVLMQWYETQVK